MGNSNHFAPAPRIVRNAYVALVDVLGFSAFVHQRGFEDSLRDYTAILRSVTEEPFTIPLEQVAFSDTFVFNTTGDDPDALKELLIAVSVVSFRLLTELGWPVRGAISKGEIVRSYHENSVIVAGTPIVDAYHYEKNQKWIGTMFSPRLVHYLQSRRELLESLESQFLIRRYFSIPLKTERAEVKPFEGYAVVPRNGNVRLPRERLSPNELHDDLPHYLETLERLKPLASDPDSQEKYDKTKQWISEVRNALPPRSLLPTS